MVSLWLVVWLVLFGWGCLALFEGFVCLVFSFELFCLFVFGLVGFVRW